ncbi:MAG: histidinol dehydrogenase [Promethearchaeota archaeon]|nr:MAG: histidinol dehydrogenase [Candidatus Lokiarchaeota archaeon]
MVFLKSLKVIYSNQISEKNISNFIPRSLNQLDGIKEDVLEIIKEVRSTGDQALIEFSKKFDGIDLDRKEIKVNEIEIKEAYKEIDEELLNALRYAKKNLMKFHKAQFREDWQIQIEKGVRAGQIYRPLDSVGIYVPGGRAIYPSTVLMAATPAFVSGVKDLLLCTPPKRNKKIAPEIIVAARECGIDKMFKVGGAQAIAAMAYGTDTVPRVQKVVGPGNKWVNAAKQLLSNEIAIDNPAGPSEILIIADESANFRYVIVDFISQIEHDPDNVGIIVSTSLEVIEDIKNNLDRYIQNSERKEIIKQALKKCLIIKAEDLNDCIRISDIIAPEHLEILTKDPKELIKKIHNAGAIFCGPYSPVPLGDYSAGTNHILPTGGNASKYSGLNVFDFLKTIDVLECTKEGLQNLSKSTMKIAEFEGFYAHKKAIEERIKDKN